ATISLLSQRNPRSMLRGRSTANGFYVYGQLEMDDLRECAAEALQRLRNGEPEMAIHPRCGTNLAVAGMMAGISSVLAGEIPPNGTVTAGPCLPRSVRSSSPLRSACTCRSDSPPRLPPTP